MRAQGTSSVTLSGRQSLREQSARSATHCHHYQRNRNVADNTKVGPKRLRWPLLLFLVSLLVPWIITVGQLRMSAYRFVLIAMLLPCLHMWLTGKAGRIRPADIALIAYCFWVFLAITMIHSFGHALQSGGMIFIETIGAYMLARCFIRNADDFFNIVNALFLIIATILPFAAYESLTGRNISREFFSIFHETFPDSYLDPRWGMRRVQSIFEHPILYGVFCASILALTHLVLGYERSFVQRWLKTGTVTVAAFLSFSGGPITAMTAQTLLLGWNWAFSKIDARWRILCGFGLLAAISIELLSNRSVPVIFISYFAFDESSARVRVDIWNYGWQSALNHPLFGVGFNDWVRAPWMSSSIDMFWIIDAVRHGIPAEFFMMLAFFAVYLPVALKKGLTDRLSVYRTAYVIAMTGFFLVGWTVYFWNATYVVFVFLLGSGVWLLDQPGDGGNSRRVGRRVMAGPEHLRRGGIET